MNANSDSEYSLEKLTELVRLMHEHEWKLRNSWMQWFLIIQSILFAAVASVMEQQTVVQLTVCILGLFICISFRVAFAYNNAGCGLLKSYWDRVLAQNGVDPADAPPVLGFRHDGESARRWRLVHYLVPWDILPVVFLCGWLVFIFRAIISVL